MPSWQKAQVDAHSCLIKSLQLDLSCGSYFRTVPQISCYYTVHSPTVAHLLEL